MLHVVPAFSRIGEENAFAVLARAQALASQGRDVINLGIGQPDMPTPAHVVEAGIKALRDGHHGYTPAVGIPPLREAVARDIHRRHGVEVSPDSVMVVPGGKVTMFMAILMFGEPGAEILYPDPGFPIYRSMIEFTGATPVPVPIREENGFAFSAAETLALITPKTRLLIVNSPANPTGGVTPKAEIDALVKGLADHPDVAVLSDEIYGTMTHDGERHHSAAELSRDPRPVGLSRRRVQDLRDDRLAPRLVGLAEAALRRRAQARGQRAFLRQRGDPVGRHRGARRPAGLRGRDGRRVRPAPGDRGGRAQRPAGRVLHRPEGAFYAFPNISRTGWKAKALASTLLEEAGVAVIGGPDFGVHGEGYIRLSYANSAENIRRALERMGRFLSERKPG
ncbi:pyridoxal phosphate-dependent aminotransferase [Methylobacterium oryzae CBMB20]